MIFYVEQMNYGRGLLLIWDANEQVIRCKCGISYSKTVSSSIKSSNSKLELEIRLDEVWNSFRAPDSTQLNWLNWVGPGALNTLTTQLNSIQLLSEFFPVVNIFSWVELNWVESSFHSVQSARLNSTEQNGSFSCDPVFIWPHVVNTDINTIYILIKIYDIMYDVQKIAHVKWSCQKRRRSSIFGKPCLCDIISNQSYSNKNKKKL